jgi:predicted phosphodiesterase
MRLALLADVHGNLPALEACLAEIERLAVDRLLHAGDLVGLCPWPDETLERLERAGAEGVRGNHEDALLAGAESPGDQDEDPRLLPDLVRAFRWTRDRASFLTRTRLERLPFSLELEVEGRGTRLFHASPVDPFERLEEGLGEDALDALLEDAPAELYLFGHLHRGYHRVHDTAHLVCAPSAGRPRDGDPRTGFALLEIDGIVQVSFPRLEYDVEAAASGLAAAGLPGSLGDLLRRGA